VHQRVVRPVEGLAQEVAGPREPAAELGGVGRSQQAEGAGLAHRREPGRAVERAGGRRVPAAREGVSGGLLERAGDVLVRLEGRRGEMPGAPVGGGRRIERLGQRTVGGAPLGRGRAVVDGGTHQRVAELEPAGLDGHQLGQLGLLQVVRLGAERTGGGQDGVQVAGVVGGRRQERPAGLGPERVGAAAEPPLDGGGGRQRLGDRLVAGQLGIGQQRRDLGQCQGVSGRQLHQPLDGGRGDRPGEGLVEQLARRLGVDPVERQLRQAARLDPRGLALAVGQQHRHALVAEPAGSVQQGLGGLGVEPLQVVDQHQHAAVLGGRREQAQRGGRDREAGCRHRRAERERPGERVRLGARDPVEPAEHRPEQVGQPRERDLRLGLDPPGPQHQQVAGALVGEPQERTLADAGVAAHKERPAASRTRMGEQDVDAGAGVLSAEQHPKLIVEAGKVEIVENGVHVDERRKSLP
jgi:hypothetical protein